MTLAVGVILTVVPLAYFIAMCVVLVPGLRRQRRLSREARGSESWPRMARDLSVAQRFRLAWRTAKGDPPADNTEAAMLVARARFMLRLQDHLAERGTGVPLMTSLFGWGAGYFAVQAACLLVQLLIGPTSQAIVSATVVLFAMAVFLAIGRFLFPRLVDRENDRLRAVVERHGPGMPGST